MTPDQENLARMAIRHTQSVYNNCGDRGRIEEMIAVFTPEAVLSWDGQTFAGVEAIHGFLSAVAKGDTPADMIGARHNLTTSRIEFESDTVALGWTYYFVSRRGTTIEDGMYIDRFEKRGERWLIADRRVKSLWFIDREVS